MPLLKQLLAANRAMIDEIRDVEEEQAT